MGEVASRKALFNLTGGICGLFCIQFVVSESRPDSKTCWILNDKCCLSDRGLALVRNQMCVHLGELGRLMPKQ